MTNSTCDYPNATDLQVPDKYSTFGTVIGPQVSNAMSSVMFNANSNETYDLLTRQTIPVVLLGRFPDPKSNLVQSSVQFVCMTANMSKEGSRVPEQNTPWANAGVDMSARMVGWAAGVVTAAMLVL